MKTDSESKIDLYSLLEDDVVKEEAPIEVDRITIALDRILRASKAFINNHNELDTLNKKIYFLKRGMN